MKALEAEGGTTFHFADDLNESVLIIAEDKREIYIPAGDILEFAAHIIRQRMIYTAENATTEEILFGG